MGDLIILDMMMPNVDGLAFLERLPTVTSRPPPVLAYSGFDKLEQLALSRGASAFLSKPFDDDALLAVAQAFPRNRRAGVGVWAPRRRRCSSN
ncbi:MAG TPA: response regulator [Polyangia bacterium]|nr:response regulator [Polyangia bacterium]